jgi:signal peptidase I
MVFQRFQISMVSGSSMEPAVGDSELILIHKNRSPNRYDLIAFEQEDKILIKRVIGVPGDAFVRSGNRLLITSTEIAPEFSLTISLSNEVASVLPASGSLQEGEYFVLGDALLVSRDSRTFGFINDSQFQGVVTKLF